MVSLNNFKHFCTSDNVENNTDIQDNAYNVDIMKKSFINVEQCQAAPTLRLHQLESGVRIVLFCDFNFNVAKC